MLGLLKKDLLLLKTQKNFLVLIVFVTFFIGWNSGESFAVSYLTFLCSFFLLSTFNYDESGNCVSFLLTLPVSRGGYVQEKYAFGLIVTAMGWVIGEIVDLAMAFMHGIPPQAGKLVFDLEQLLAFWVFIAVLIPLLLKFGVDRGRIAVFFCVALVVAVGFLGKNLFEDMDVDIGAALETMLAHQPLVLAGAALGTAVILAVSYLCSVRIMNRKEF